MTTPLAIAVTSQEWADAREELATRLQSAHSRRHEAYAAGDAALARTYDETIQRTQVALEMFRQARVRYEAGVQWVRLSDEMVASLHCTPSKPVLLHILEDCGGGGLVLAAAAADTLDSLREEALPFQNATFPTATPHSKSKHLLKEAAELHACPDDLEEMADVFLLLCHLAEERDLVGAVRAKLDKNRGRVWGAPDADGVVEHLDEDAAA